MKTKIGIEVAHVTRDLDTTFKVKRPKVKVTGGGAYCVGVPQSLLILVLNSFMKKNLFSTEIL